MASELFVCGVLVKYFADVQWVLRRFLHARSKLTGHRVDFYWCLLMRFSKTVIVCARNLRCKRAQGTNGISAEFFKYICTEVTEGNLACVLLSQSGLQAAALLTAVRADRATAFPPEMMQITLAFVAKKSMALDAGLTFGGPHARMIVHRRFGEAGQVGVPRGVGRAHHPSEATLATEIGGQWEPGCA